MSGKLIGGCLCGAARFEGVVENRDLISSYLPVLAPGTDRIVGVFEVYSDVTPFLAQIKLSGEETRKAAARNQAKVAQEAEKNQAQVEDTSSRGVLIVLALLVVLRPVTLGEPYWWDAAAVYVPGARMCVGSAPTLLCEALNHRGEGGIDGDIRTARGRVCRDHHHESLGRRDPGRHEVHRVRA